MKDCRLHNKEQRALAILDTMTRAPNPMLPIVDLVEMPLTLQKALDPHASQTSTIRMPYYENGGADGPGIQRSLRLKPLLSGNAAARFHLPSKGRLAAGADADIIIVDMGAQTHIAQSTLLTNARAISRLTDGRRYQGRILRTILSGATVWDGAAITAPPGIGRFVNPEDPR